MSPPNKLRKTVEAGIERTPDGIIRFEVDQILSLGTDDINIDDEGRYSLEIEVGGVPWRANVARGRILTASLCCMTNQTSPWFIDMDAEIYLVHSDSRRNFITKASETFCKNDNFLCERLLTWKNVVDNEEGFVKDNKITIVIRFWVNNKKGIGYFPRIDFTDSTDPCHDVALVIEGDKIYASKQILAVNSQVFKAMFYSNFSEKNKEEIELKEVKREEFLERLDVIYPSCKRIKDYSAEFLIKLGDQFQIASVIDRAQHVLIKSDYVSNEDKLRIADKYRLFGLQEHCISMLKTTQNFKDLQNSPVYKDISDGTKVTLFDRLVKGLPGDLALSDDDC